MTIKELENKSLKNSADVSGIMFEILKQVPEQDRTKEHFWILGLNVKNQINYVELVSLGSMTASLVHPREVFKFAIMKDSASIIACHNHPSGGCSPSTEDIKITNRLVEAGNIIGIKVLDHLIINNRNEYHSLMEGGHIK